MSLNRMLNGGIKTGFVTDFFGASNTGKTQICFQLCVAVQLLDEEGGAIFVDSLGTFRPERIMEIAHHMNLKGDIFERIMVVKARSVREQIDVPKRLKVAPFNVRLLIIDTLTDNFTFEYQGEERAIDKQSNLAKHLHDLCSLALREGVAVVVTNTVRSRIKDDRYYEVETGGNVASQGAHIRVHLSKEPHGMSARLVQPPIDRATAYFKINSMGVVDNGRY
ncbi:MAG: hypothetical protein L6M37_03695 [Candidatus Methylarchaceae archaeon HK02M1]|nr:hypothetical protein [Candidatus Methylarchaceae archaeon HK02M1]